MNDEELTTRFREALDGAAPDPLLFNRVESAVHRKTLSRRIALGLAAVAVPVTALAAVTVLPRVLDRDGPDVLTVDQTPGGDGAPTPSESPDPSQPNGDVAYVAPVDLSPTVFAWVEGDAIVLGDKSGAELPTVTIDDADGIVALAGSLGPDRQHLAAVVRYLDQDDAPEFRVDRLSWDRTDRAPDVEHVVGPMFSQVADATYSAAFDHEGRLVVFFDGPADDPGLNVTTVSIVPDVTVLSGTTIAVDGSRLRLDGFDGTGLAYATTGDGAIVVVDLEAGTSSNTAFTQASSWIFDELASRILISSDEAIWVLRDFPDRAGMREIGLPFDAMALDSDDLRLFSGPFGLTHLRFGDQVWRLDETRDDAPVWVEVGSLPGVVTNFTAAPEIPRPVQPTDTSAWTSDAVTEETELDEGGAGALRVGMTLREVRAVTGQEFIVGHDFDGWCFPARIAGVEGLGFTFLPEGEGPVDPEDAVLATVESFDDRGARGNRTTQGVGPGMHRDDVFAAYDGVEETPNHYDPSSSHLDVDGQDGLGIRFNVTPDGTIRSVYVGNEHRKALEGCA